MAGLVYTLWELVQPNHEAYLERLRLEMRRISYNEKGPMFYSDIDSAVWLDCCIREGLRLHTPSGHIQTRVVPPGGAMIARYRIPEEV